jgi:hypothetical protein
MPTPRRRAEESQPGIDRLPQNASTADAAAAEARHRRIADRAYARAERRDFTPGQELDDWLAAEAEEDNASEEEGRG